MAAIAMVAIGYAVPDVVKLRNSRRAESRTFTRAVATETYAQIRVPTFSFAVVLAKESVSQVDFTSVLRTVERPISSADAITVKVAPLACMARAASSFSTVITVGRPPTWPRALAAASPARVRSES